jgi:hypothetical protein
VLPAERHAERQRSDDRRMTEHRKRHGRDTLCAARSQGPRAPPPARDR